MEYKQTKKQDRKIEKFILISKKDIAFKIGFKRKLKSDNKSDKNKKQKSLNGPRLVQQWTWGNQKKTLQISSTKVKKFQFRLPTITMSNVRSLPNKMEKIEEMMEDAEYFASDVMFFTETWLNSNSPQISLDGYASYRVDRDAELTQKCRGGGMIMLVKQDWASDVKVEHIRNTPDYEVMVVIIIQYHMTILRMLHHSPSSMFIYQGLILIKLT